GLGPGRGDDGKFVAVEPRKKGALAGRFEAPRDLPQQGVAHGVAEYIIDRLEAIKIHAKQRKAFIRNRCQSDRGNDALIERGAIGKIGQRIVTSQMLNALLVALSLGEIVDDADEILRFSVFLHRQSRRGDDSRVCMMCSSQKEVWPEAITF